MRQAINKGLYCFMNDFNSGNGHDDCTQDSQTQDLKN